MNIIAIDPGPTISGWVHYLHKPHGVGEVLESGGKTDNGTLLKIIKMWDRDDSILVVEQVMNYGMIVGQSVFDTCFWTGRYCEAFDGLWQRIPFVDVKMSLCHTTQAKEANVRQVVRDMFPQTGQNMKGEPTEIGTTKHPGPLFKVKYHAWSALALAITAGRKLDHGQLTFKGNQ